MGQLTRSVTQRIFQALNNEYFVIGDFEVTLPDSGNELATISFRAEPTFHFRIFAELRTPAGAGGMVSVSSGYTQSPGKFRSVETMAVDLSAAINALPTWCKNIDAELRARMPILDDIDELRSQLEEHLAEHLSATDADMFTAEELAVLNDKFDQLFAKFQELAERHQLTEAELAKVKTEIDVIKDTASQYQKKIWAALAASRVAQVVKRVLKNKEVRQLMYDGAKKILIGD